MNNSKNLPNNSDIDKDLENMMKVMLSIMEEIEKNSSNSSRYRSQVIELFYTHIGILTKMSKRLSKIAHKEPPQKQILKQAHFFREILSALKEEKKSNGLITTNITTKRSLPGTNTGTNTLKI